ncbi:MAG: LPS export ABC transporter permease LptF, partial [Deltaproteobacteria bacterium]
MKITSLINRYIFKEFILPFTVNVLFFTFIFLMAELIQITNWIVNYNVSLSIILRMIFYQTPFFLIFVIPLSIMITVLLTFLRLSSENEILAIKSGGVSLYALLPPVFAFCLIGSALTIFMTFYGQSWGRSALRELTEQVVSESIDIGLKERTFNDSFSGVTIYVNQIDLKNKDLVDVFIEDSRQPDKVNTVIAPKGKIFNDPRDAAAHLRLFNGSILQTNLKKKTAQSIQFDTYDIRLETDRSPGEKKNKPKRPKEMTIGELSRYVRKSDTKDERYYSALLELHRRYSIPIGCFALGLLAVPLGIQAKSAKRSFG